MTAAATTRTVRLGLAVLAALVWAAPASAADGVPAQRARAHAVQARVDQLGIELEQVIQRWDGERVALQGVAARIRTTNAELRIARTNLTAARRSLEQRLFKLYVSPPPGALDIIVGSRSLSDLIDRIETTQVLSREDRAIAAAAERFQTETQRRKTTLEHEERARTALVAHLAAEQTRIEAGIATQRRLLASIHETIATLQAQEAARERRQAALARARVARAVAAARRRAAAEAVEPRPAPALPAPPQPPPAPPPAPAAPSANPPPPPTPTPSPTPPASPAPPTTHADAAAIAARYLGVPYVWGGATPAGFDCSGLVMYVYDQLGVSLPHYTVSQWNATMPITGSELEPGDLVFFDGLSHVGIYIGNGQFIHAPHTGTVVQIASLTGYWASHLDGARRVP